MTARMMHPVTGRATDRDRPSAEISALVVNYQTPDLLETAVRSFKRHYPEVPLIVIDNGSRDDSGDLVRVLSAELRAVEAVFLPENIFHGPAMHRGLSRIDSPYAFVFDSDTETVSGGFLEEMRSALDADEAAYGAGHVVHVDRRGFARAPGVSGIPVLSSAHMLLKTPIYRELPPFVHHGLPALKNFRQAQISGYKLVSYPIGAYVHHLGRGTAARYGYGLGFRARLEYVLSKIMGRC